MHQGEVNCAPRDPKQQLEILLSGKRRFARPFVKNFTAGAEFQPNSHFINNKFKFDIFMPWQAYKKFYFVLKLTHSSSNDWVSLPKCVWLHLHVALIKSIPHPFNPTVPLQFFFFSKEIIGAPTRRVFWFLNGNWQRIKRRVEIERSHLIRGRSPSTRCFFPIHAELGSAKKIPPRTGLYQNVVPLCGVENIYVQKTAVCVYETKILVGVGALFGSKIICETINLIGGKFGCARAYVIHGREVTFTKLARIVSRVCAHG